MTTLLIITDSAQALERAYPDGPPKGAKLLTSAPAVLRDTRWEARAVDEHIDGKAIADLNEATCAASRQIYEEALAAGHPATQTLARWPYLNHVLWLKAATLRSDIWDSSGVLLVPVADRHELQWRFSGPLPELLAENSHWMIKEIPVQVSGEAYPKPGLLLRLRIAGWQVFGYQFFRTLWARLPFGGPVGTAYILRDVDLLRETALNLAFCGFALRELSLPGSVESPELAVDTQAEEIATNAFDKHIAPRIDGPAAVAARKVGILALRTDLAAWGSARTYWRRIFPEQSKRKPVVVLSNALMQSQVDALGQVCAERGYPFAMFQHGVTAEISDCVGSYKAIAENTIASVYYVFNPAAQQLHSANYMADGEVVNVGLPQQYRSMAKARQAGVVKTEPPIWYISTALYTGNVGLLHRGVTDDHIARIEIEVIENILAKLPHRVLFKSYPGLKYSDPDPILKAARKQSNITVEDRAIDLRYLMSRAQVLVTSNATSTLGWCLVSQHPLIYIEQPGITPLSPRVREALESSVLFVDAGQPDYLAQAREILSLPLAEIEALWQARKNTRKQAIEDYFDGGNGNAGRTAAMDLIARSRQPAQIAAHHAVDNTTSGTSSRETT